MIPPLPMRKLAIFAAAFSAAVFLAVYLLPEGWWFPVCAVCALAALPGLLFSGKRRLGWMLCALGLAAGMAWTGAYTAWFHAPARALAGQTARVSAVVCDWPEETGYGYGVLVRVECPEGPDQKARLYLRGESPPRLRPGDRLAFTGDFRLADTIAGEKNDYYYAKGVTLTAYIRTEEELTVSRPERVPPRHWPVYVSRALKDSAAAVFPAEASGLVTALVTGDKSALCGGDYSALRRAGLAHMVAVSGLHVSYLAGALTVLLGRGRRRTALAVAALLFSFAAVAGNAPSALRAVLMCTLLQLAPLTGREDDKPTTLAAVLMVLLVQNPYAAASVSLQLSFAAVAGITLFSGPLQARWTARLPRRAKRRTGKLALRAGRGMCASLALTVGALVFTTPLSAWYFNSISLMAPLSNLLTVWAVSGLFLGGIALALLGLALPGAAAVLALPVSLLARWILWAARGIARLPFAAVSASSVYLTLWLTLAYVLLTLWLLRGRRGERRRPLFPVCAGAVCLCAAVLLNTFSLTGGSLTVSVLDVGQGLSVAFYSQGRAMLVDCGGSGLEDPGDVAADYVQSLGLTRLDLLVLTHCHTDHAGGVPQLLERLEVGLLLLPDVEEEEDDPLRREILRLAAEKGVGVRLISEDARVSLGGAEVTVYAPLGDGGANEEGLSVLCTAGDFDALITGDMNTVVESRLIKYGRLPDIELLVAGHHGSKYACSEELLLAAAPEYAVISVGYNTYGHPAPETLERLAAAGCAIYRTDWQGTVTITATERENRHAAQSETG